MRTPMPEWLRRVAVMDPMMAWALIAQGYGR